MIFAVMGIVGTVADLRLGRIVMRELIDARDDVEEVLGSYVTFRFAMGVAAYAVVIAVMLVGRYSEQVLLGTVVAGLVLVLAAIGVSLDLLFTAKLWTRAMAGATLASMLAQLALTVGLYATGTHSIILFCVPAVLCEVVALGWRLQRLPRRIRLRWRVDLVAWRTWLREVLPLAIGGAIVTVYLRIDMIMVSKMRSLSAVGQYAIGYKFSDLIGFIPIALSGPFLVTLTKSWPEDEATYASSVQKVITVIAMVAAVVVVEFAFFSRPAIGLLYGSRYEVASLATKGLVGAVLVSCFSSMFFTAMVAVGRNRLYPLAALVGLVINVGLNLVVIPLWSYNGAALSTLVTELAVFVILAVGVRKLPGFGNLPWTALSRVVIAGLVAAGVAAMCRAVMFWEMAGVLSLLVYGVGLAVLRAGADLVEFPPRQVPWPRRRAPEGFGPTGAKVEPANASHVEPSESSGASDRPWQGEGSPPVSFQ